MRYVRLSVAVFCLTLSASFASAQTAAPASQPKAKNAQQQKMADCNAEAKTEKLTGHKRKEFMKLCLPSDPLTAKNILTVQQEEMKRCNADATAKSLKGAERKKFMSHCLNG